MNVIVDFLFLISINYLGLRCVIMQKTFVLPVILNPDRMTVFSGIENFIILTLACAIICAAPLGLYSTRLLLWLLLMCIWISKRKTYLHFGFVAFLYVCYLLFLALSVLWSSYPFFGFRVILKYLLPMLILLGIPNNIIHEEVFPCSIKAICYVFMLYIIYHYLSLMGARIILGAVFGGFWWWGPAIIDSYSIFLPIFVIAAKLFCQKKYLLLIVPMALSPLIGYVVRTGLVAMVISATAMFIFHYRIKALPFLAMLALGIFLSTAFIPQLREKMFYKDYATEEQVLDFENWDMDMVNSNGRFLLWDFLLNQFFHPHTLKGSGAGSEQGFMESNEAREFFSIMVCHCDYVQILCDNGLIGISLYGATLLCLIIHCFLLYNDTNLHIYCRHSAFIAGTGMCGMAAAMMTDNVVNYTMCTLVFPFTFYAMALGLKKFPKEEEILPQNQTTEQEDVQCDHPALQ